MQNEGVGDRPQTFDRLVVADHQRFAAGIRAGRDQRLDLLGVAGRQREVLLRGQHVDQRARLRALGEAGAWGFGATPESTGGLLAGFAFAGAWDAGVAKKLRLMPDAAGPITMLRPFGNLVVWPRAGKMPVAHPWLIYAELLHGGEPRAIEAAEELRRNHLS